MRGAYAKRFSANAPPVVALFSCFLIVLRGLGRVLVSAPEARSAEGDGRRQPPVSAAADLYQDKHTPNCHLPFFRVFFMLFRLVFLHCFPPKKAAFLLPLENGLFVLRYAVTEVRKAVHGNLRVLVKIG